MSGLMDYGPDWPPIPEPPRHRRRGPSLAERAAYAGTVTMLMMAACWTLWRQTSIPLPMPAEPSTTYATTAVGPPVAGGGHASHRPAR